MDHEKHIIGPKVEIPKRHHDKKWKELEAMYRKKPDRFNTEDHYIWMENHGCFNDPFKYPYLRYVARNGRWSDEKRKLYYLKKPFLKSNHNSQINYEHLYSTWEMLWRP